MGLYILIGALLFYFLDSGYAKGPSFGEVVILNKFLNKPEDGRRDSTVPPQFKGTNIESYAGYIRVDQHFESDMFFWFFKANTGKQEPLVIWLPSGPGDQAVTSIFEENGPFYVKQSRGLKERRHHWSQVVNMLHFDSPIGTGFSSTKSGYAKDLNTVGIHLCSALKTFFQIFPDMKNVPLYIGGESWGAKQAIMFMYTLHNGCNGHSQPKMGLILGNGFYDPVNMIDASDIYLSLGFLSPRSIQEYKRHEEDIKKLIGSQRFSKAFDSYDKLVKGKLWKYGTFFKNHTQLESPDNGLGLAIGRSLFGNLHEYMEKDVTRRSIHVGTRPYHSDDEVVPNLKSEIMRSVVPELSFLMQNYRVLMYHGQFNMFIPYWTASQALSQVSWCGKAYRSASSREPWYVDGSLAGYITTTSAPRCAGRLTEVLVRDAGRYTARDQSQRMQDIINKFTHEQI